MPVFRALGLKFGPRVFIIGSGPIVIVELDYNQASCKSPANQKYFRADRRLELDLPDQDLEVDTNFEGELCTGGWVCVRPIHTMSEAEAPLMLAALRVSSYLCTMRLAFVWSIARSDPCI